MDFDMHLIFFRKYYLAVPISLLVFGLFLLSQPSLVLAQSPGDFGLKTTAQTAGLSISSTNPIKIVGNIINYLLGFLGVIFLGLIIYAGFLWMTASGNSEQVQKAKELIGNAVVGLIIILAAFAISTFVFSNLKIATGGAGI